jgi:hypothetical protein
MIEVVVYFVEFSVTSEPSKVYLISISLLYPGYVNCTFVVSSSSAIWLELSGRLINILLSFVIDGIPILLIPGLI